MAYFLYNGDFYRSNDCVFSPKHLHCLIFKEEIKVVNSNIIFWEEHLRLLKFHFKLFNLRIPMILDNDGKELIRQVERSLVKNKYFHSAKIRISFFKETNQISYLLELWPSSSAIYQMRPDGFSLELFKQITKSDSTLSSLSIGSEKLWEIAKAYHSSDETIPVILNDNQHVLETPGSNIFILKDQTIRTPHAASGAYINPARQTVKQITERFQMNYLEDRRITPDQLYDAEEIFLADDINGVQFVKGFGMKRYFRKRTTAIALEFNRLLIH